MDNDMEDLTQESQSKRMHRDERREAIMKAAMEIFHEKGYEGTSLNAIIERIGGSKRSFYTEFGGKEGLFRALLMEKTEKQIREQEIASAQEKDLRVTLLGVARSIIKTSIAPDSLSLYRFMAQDGIRFPGVLNAFYEGMHLKAEKHIAEMLEAAAARDDASLPCPSAIAADHFLSMLHGKLFFEFLFNIRDAVTDEEIDAYVASIVDLFLHGIRPAESPAKRD